MQLQRKFWLFLIHFQVYISNATADNPTDNRGSIKVKCFFYFKMFCFDDKTDDCFVKCTNSAIEP